MLERLAKSLSEMVSGFRNADVKIYLGFACTKSLCLYGTNHYNHPLSTNILVQINCLFDSSLSGS